MPEPVQFVRRMSPNQGVRGKYVPTMVVLHADASKSEDATLSWLLSKESQASYHVYIARDGTAYRLVDDQRRAWHAGKSGWKGYKDINSQSLGLSFANRHDDTEPMTEAQQRVGHAVLAEWKAKYDIKDVVTHAMVAPGRKIDPDHILGFDLREWV